MTLLNDRRPSLRAVVGACFLFAALPGRADLVLDDTEVRRLGIRTAPVAAATTLRVTEQPGVVRVPNAGLHVVTAPAEGVLTRVLVAEGTDVVAGAPLAELAGPGIAALESDFLDAVVADRGADAHLTRVRGLVDDGVLPARALEAAELTRSRALGTRRAARAALDTAGTAAERVAALVEGATPRSRLRLPAPASGTVLRQFARPGERLALAQPIVEIGELSPLWVEAHVARDRVRGFGPGARAIVDGDAGVRVEGRVITVGRRVHQADRGLLVRVLVDDPDGRLIPGQPVQVTLERTATPDALALPRAALVLLDREASVFALRDGVYRPAAVRVLAESGETLVVTAGLIAGDAVVVAGTSALKALLAADAP